jgi:tetratricopeptide (TPR) repeat protein
MTDDEHSAQYLLLKGIISAGLVGVGFLSGGALSGLVAGFVGSVGGNWFSNLSENAFDSYCRHWFTHDGALNHDLRNALARAFQGAVRQTRDEWQATDVYQRLDRHNAEMTRKALNWLHDDTQRLFERDTLGDLLAEREADLLAMVQAHTPAAAPELPANLLGPILDEYLKGRPDEFRAFVEQHLIASWLLRFREELKTDKQAHTAYENLWQTSISVALATMQQQTAQTQQDVEALLLLVDELGQELRGDHPAPAVVSPEALAAALKQQVVPYVKAILDELRAIRGDTGRILAELANLKAAMAGQPDPATQAAYRQKELALARDLLATLPTAALPASAALPPGSRMPFGRTPTFVGREPDLLAIAAALKGGQTTAISQAASVHGLGGIGKTTVASEFVHRYGQFFAGGVFWLSFADPANIPVEIAQCGGAGHMQLFTDAAGLPLPDQVAAVQRAWAEEMPRLLVFDNVDTDDAETLVQQYRPTTGGACVLITSRRGTWDTDLGITALPLGTLPRNEGITLLHKFRADLSDADANALAHELGDLPLALHLAGSFLKKYANTSQGDPVTFLKRLRAQALLNHPALTGRAVSDGWSYHEKSVARAFALSYERLDANNPIDALALALLARAAYFAPGEAIPRELLLASVGYIQETIKHKRWEFFITRHKLPVSIIVLRHCMLMEQDKLPWWVKFWLKSLDLDTTDVETLDADALHRLTELGLLEEAEDGLVLHRLLAAFVQKTTNDRIAQAAVEAVVGNIATSRTYQGYLPPQILLHMRYVTEVAMQREDMSSADLAGKMGMCLAEKYGEYRTGQGFLEHQVNTRERIFDESHPRIIAPLNNLAVQIWRQGDHPTARILLERALALCEQKLGKDDPETARALANLGLVLKAQGEHERARTLFERCLTIREKVFGLDYHLNAQPLTSLAMLSVSEGDYDTARTFCERAVKVYEAACGRNHQETAHAISLLASVLKAQGDHAAARSLYEEVLEIREKFLGENHPDLANTLHNLAGVYYAQGDYEAARPLYERALEIYEQIRLSDLALTLNELGVLYESQHQYTEAQPLFERALIIWEQELGPQHPKTIVVRRNLERLIKKMDTPRADTSPGSGPPAQEP